MFGFQGGRKNKDDVAVEAVAWCGAQDLAWSLAMAKVSA